MKTINLVLCSCKKYYENQEWKPYKELEDLITKKIRADLPKAKVIINKLDMPAELKEKKSSTVTATLDEKEYKINITLKLSRCNICSREGGNYFEAVLQIRSANLVILEEGLQYMQERVKSLRLRGLFINKVESFENGFDLYMTNRRLAQRIAIELQDRYGGKLKVSPQLFSRNKQTSKDIYRVIIFLELPGFARNDLVLVNDKVYIIDKIGRKVKLIELVNGSSLISDYEKLEYTVLKKVQTYVSRTYPSLEVINPHDYQSSMVKNKPKQVFTSGQSINVVIHKGIYVVD